MEQFDLFEPEKARHLRWSDRADWSAVPEALRTEITTWVEYGKLPSNFMFAILTNDLHLTVLLAGKKLQPAIPGIVEFIARELPGAAWGSQEKVLAWAGERTQ